MSNTAPVNTSKMIYTVSPGTIKFSGMFDETTTTNYLNEALEKVKALGVQDTLIIDMEDVSRCNSMGIVTWLRFMKGAGLKFHYVNCPPWLVHQFNMVFGFFDSKSSTVESIVIPYYNEELDQEIRKSFVIGKDIPLQKSYESFHLEAIESSGSKFEADIDPKKYFQFLTKLAS